MIPQNTGVITDKSIVQNAIIALSDSFYREHELEPRARYVYFGESSVQQPLSEIGLEGLSGMSPRLEEHGGYVVFRTGNGPEKRCSYRKFVRLAGRLGRQFSDKTTIVALQSIIPEMSGFVQCLEARLKATGKFFGDYVHGACRVPA